jgi:hypothetical protein
VSNNVGVANHPLDFALSYVEARCSEPVKKVAQASGCVGIQKLDILVWGLAGISPQQKKSFALAKPIRGDKFGSDGMIWHHCDFPIVQAARSITDCGPSRYSFSEKIITWLLYSQTC